MEAVASKEKLFMEVLGDKEDILLIRGKLIKPEPMEKKDHSGYYIIFEIKVVRESKGSKYDHQYNSYSIIVPSQDVKTMAPVIKQMKNCEVLVSVRPNARIRRGQSGGRFNSVDYYLEDIYLMDDLNEAPISRTVLPDM